MKNQAQEIKQAPKVRWRPFLKIYKEVNIPWLQYISAFLLSFVITQIGLRLAPIRTNIQLAEFFEDNALYLFIGLSLLQIVVRLAQTASSLFANQIFTRQVRKFVLNKILRLDMRTIEEHKSGGLVSRITNDATTASSPLSMILLTPSSIYGLVGALISMWTLNPTLTQIYAFVVPFAIFIFWFVGRIQFTIQYKIYGAYGIMTDYFGEHIKNIKNVKAFAAENHEMRYGREAIRTRYKADIYSSIMGNIAIMVGGLISQFSMLVIFVLGTMYVRQGIFENNELVTFHNYSMILLPSIFELLTHYQSIKSAHGGTSMIGELIEGSEEIVKKEKSMPSITDVIEFDQVTFSYQKEPVLKDVSFIIPAGKTTAIIGKNGSGKSTLFKLLQRFYEPVKGKIRYGDEDVSSIHLNEWRKSMVYVSQDAPILMGSLRDNVTYGSEEPFSDEEVMKSAELAGCLDFIEKLPEGLDTEVGEGGSRLSGGQRQRIAIARAFLLNPSYLLLDEATSHLDTKTESIIKHSLQQLMKDKTVIKIAHNFEFVEDADQIIVLNEGEVDDIGSPKELLKRNNLYQQFVGQNNQ